MALFYGAKYKSVVGDYALYKISVTILIKKKTHGLQIRASKRITNPQGQGNRVNSL